MNSGSRIRRTGVRARLARRRFCAVPAGPLFAIDIADDQGRPRHARWH